MVRKSRFSPFFLFPFLGMAGFGEYANSSQASFASLEVHLGYENEVSADRINYPVYILLSGADWKTYNEQFRQLGALVDTWDRVRQGEFTLDETSNVAVQGSDYPVFRREIRIIRTDWVEVGEKCGYRENGKPHSGCAFNKRLPSCTIVVPRKKLYAGGDIDEFHDLLGHEMWHCLVGSFH